MRVLCINLPNWPIQRLVVANPALDRRRPILLHSRDARRGQVVASCNVAARKRGVRVAMPLAEATALTRIDSLACASGLCVSGFCVPADEAADLAALAKLAERCEQFSPLVGWKTVGGPEMKPGHLFLDITAVGVLFGGEGVLLQAVVEELAGLGYDARVAIADTVGAAWAGAMVGSDGPAGPGQRGEGLSAVQRYRPAVGTYPVPISVLRLPGETVDLLAQLGITELEQLRKLPRASLPARLGEELVLRLEQFEGTTAETIVAYRPPPEFVAQRVLEYPAESRELIEKIVTELVERLAVDLAARRQGAVQLSCRLDTKPPVMWRVGLYRPSARAAHLRELFRAQLEQPLPGPVERVTLAAPLTAPLQNCQQELFEGSRREAERQFELLVDRMSSRLGPEAVLRPQLTADPLPERAVELVPLLEAPKKPKRRMPPAERPCLLRSPPMALLVVSVVPDGPPISFRIADQDQRVDRWWGPERIESGWWRGPHVRRDYYRVATATGQRFWLFRRLADGAWFLHGEFA